VLDAERSADWQSAIRQVGNLRYKPGTRESCAAYAEERFRLKRVQIENQPLLTSWVTEVVLPKTTG